MPTRRKCEGLVVDPGGRDGWVVTDPDDPFQAAELCRISIEI